MKKAAYLVSNALTKFAVPQLEGGRSGRQGGSTGEPQRPEGQRMLPAAPCVCALCAMHVCGWWAVSDVRPRRRPGSWRGLQRQWATGALRLTGWQLPSVAERADWQEQVAPVLAGRGGSVRTLAGRRPPWLQASSTTRRGCGTASWRTRLRRSCQSRPRWGSSSRWAGWRTEWAHGVGARCLPGGVWRRRALAAAHGCAGAGPWASTCRRPGCCALWHSPTAGAGLPVLASMHAAGCFGWPMRMS